MACRLTGCVWSSWHYQKTGVSTPDQTGAGVFDSILDIAAHITEELLSLEPHEICCPFCPYYSDGARKSWMQNSIHIKCHLPAALRHKFYGTKWLSSPSDLNRYITTKHCRSDREKREIKCGVIVLVNKFTEHPTTICKLRPEEQNLSPWPDCVRGSLGYGYSSSKG